MESMPESNHPGRRTVLKGAAAISAAAVLAACGRTPAKSGGKAIKVTDQRSKVLSLEGPARRIVTIPFPAAAIVIAIDKSVDHLVGMHEFSWLAARDGVLGSMFPDVLKVAHDMASETFSPNIESILKLEPDVVVQWASQGDEILTPLENAGLPVLGVDYGTLDDVKTWLAMFSEMLGKRGRGTAMIERLDADRADMEALAAKRVGPKPKVLYFLRFAEGLKVTGAKTFNDEYIKLVGADNAAAVSGQVDVDVEQVLKWDPDIVLLGNFDAAMPDDLYGDRRWKDLSAVKSRRVYKVPLGGYRWDPPSHESPLMWSWLSQLAFPGTSGSGLRAKIDEDYRFFYGTAPTSAQVDKMLWLDANGTSADYGQFRTS